VSKAPAIVRLLTTDTAEPVRIQAAEALGALGSPSSVPALIRIAESDPSSDVRVRAITALGRIDSPSVNVPIRRFLAHGNDLEFQVAAVAAGRRRLLDVEPDLLAICKSKDRSERVRSAAVTALALMGSSNALATITLLLRDSSPIVRFNAIGAADEIQDKTSAGDLTRILNDAGEAKFVRIRAASALARMETNESLNALRTMGEGHDEFMAMHSIVALSQTDAPQARALAAALHTRAQDAFVISVTERILRGHALPWGQR